MDIAALSTALSQSSVQQQASISVMKMVMDISKGQALDLTAVLESSVKMMEQSANPHLGGNIDIKL